MQNIFVVVFFKKNFVCFLSNISGFYCWKTAFAKIYLWWRIFNVSKCFNIWYFLLFYFSITIACLKTKSTFTCYFLLKQPASSANRFVSSWIVNSLTILRQRPIFMMRIYIFHYCYFLNTHFIFILQHIFNIFFFFLHN